MSNERAEKQSKKTPLRIRGDERFGWLDRTISKEAMDCLWKNIDNKKSNAGDFLAGNISASYFIPDKDNWFFENILKECTLEYYYKDWINYYNVHVVKNTLPPEFELNQFWVNYQKQHEFNPPHVHKECLYSFVVFMKIPTHWKEQHNVITSSDGVGCASDFQFIVNGSLSPTTYEIELSSEDEARILFFPGYLMHQVFPFYGTEEDRITVSGNITFKN